MKMQSKCLFVFALVALVCQCRSVPTPQEDEASVVSVYTQPPGNHTHSLDVYKEIANNIAERITSPIYRFLGINATQLAENATKSETKNWDDVELLDEAPEDSTKPNIKPVDNDISSTRDVEELSVVKLEPKTEKKPEKVTLITNNDNNTSEDNVAVNEINTSNDTESDLTSVNDLDAVQPKVNNGTGNDIDDDFDDDDDTLEFDDVEEGTRQNSGFSYFWDLITSFFQFAFGAVLSFFRPNSNSR